MSLSSKRQPLCQAYFKLFGQRSSMPKHLLGQPAVSISVEHLLLKYLFVQESSVSYVNWPELLSIYNACWVYNDKDGSVEQKQLNYVPGLYKIFDEILVNAADNYVRDNSQTYIKVTINEKDGWISVENNGRGLPVEEHKEHQMYVPEMVFGHLLTSDNYDDSEKKVTGGRNGYGAKLTNIFSTKFEIECGDSERRKKYQQTWEENMRKKQKSKISAHLGESFTKITFWPDLSRFGMKKLDKDIVGLMCRRVVDVAGTTPAKCKVHLNGKRLDINSFKDYISLYTGTEDVQIVHEKCHERWEVAMTVSDGQFQQVSFVNNIATTKGGTHVVHVADQLVEAITHKVNKQNKGGMEVKPYHVRNYLWVFVNTQIENPSFDSQTKETMTLKQSKFGSSCAIPDKMINNVLKTGIVDMVLQWAKAKEEIDLGKTLKGGSSAPNKKTKRLLNIPKLEDANLAGSRDGRECTLILTEGDSAKSLAVAGLGVIGRDRYGVFPLRGKILNVRDATFAQTMGNAEIANITKIVGLEPRKEYHSTNGLRYGSIMVMTDQDYDGSHIKGLILNFVQHWWPSLFKLPGFMTEFVTPIVKVSRRSTTQQFFTMQEYEKWKEENNNGRGWHLKYYKGLGTSTMAEAKEYFSNINEHSLSFEYTGQNDDEAFDMAFNKKRADDRKEWINDADDEEFVDHSKDAVTYLDFINKELVQFAKYDVLRAIPSVVDGFKPVQRKIMWASFKRNLKSDTKVAQLAGYVSEHAAYHHGESSLQGAIVGLAQTFVGANNISLLVPSGQFGTRIQGGKDAASARYIYTRLEKVTRLIFHPSDDALLDFQVEEGQRIEPKWYIPVLPLVLVNGAEGIGTGWSTFLPNYHPRDIIANLKRYLRCQPVQDMCPWYSGFKGSIVLSPDKVGYESVGVIEKRGPTTLEITELPIRKWTQDYKEGVLQPMLSTDGPGTGQIEDFKECHTEVAVHFIITVTEEQMKAHEYIGLEKSFKLRSSLSTNNMMFFDKDGKIKRYSDERHLIEEFAELRLEYYHKRKAHLVRVLRIEAEILAAKARFIQEVIDEKLKVKNRKKDALIEDLRKRGFKTLREITEGEDVASDGSTGKWEYLLGMPIWSLTAERVAHLLAQLKDKQAELHKLECTAPEELWESDLNEILKELGALEARSRAAAAEEKAAQKRAALSSTQSSKKAKTAASSTPLPTPALPPGQLSTTALAEMQERQLKLTLTELPGLFNDMVPKKPPPPPGLEKLTKSAANTAAGGKGDEADEGEEAVKPRAKAKAFFEKKAKVAAAAKTKGKAAKGKGRGGRGAKAKAVKGVRGRGRK
ncbi:top2 [Symbiodinium natans]|uniref:DNA topoisomerase 2 n=1 Tax=Symbiodinium natans TaxID=878477 RepID=A0A812U2J5_9DINO|nr:top2 [Symbiodinium natans]